MTIELQPGRYVVAVSGGVDSVALLNMLTKLPGLELLVAHFDHGIRPDSADDTRFVAAIAKQYGLPFVTQRAELGTEASEAIARESRYTFLQRAQNDFKAQAIITAHHQDDVLETAIHNLLRGTGRRGLTSLQSTEHIKRPLLYMSKADITAYALQQKLSWREDTTNHDERYTRNYIRHRLLVRFDTTARQRLLRLIERQHSTNQALDLLMADQLQTTNINRRWFIDLPHDVAKEYMASWLRTHQVGDFDRLGIERLVVQSKTRPVGKRLDVLHGRQLMITQNLLVLQ